MKYRHELKYLINHLDYSLIRTRLRGILSADSHAGEDGSYTVRSLYFDDYFNHAYHDKYAGVNKRSKYRIRIYNHSDHTINLEKKVKLDHYNYKQVASLTKDQVYDLLQGNYRFLLESPNNLMRVFYHECVTNMMRPRVIVDYDREPYLFEAGDVRITFDRNLRTGLAGFDIFDRSIPTIETLDPGLLILEVKFTEFLPELIRKILPPKASEYAAVSKYILCCDKAPYQRQSQF
ncbi:MAG: polyphosphate polymerase domain-containing protein [Anaerolineales bacterium]|nr:polyphosphate polymerase domain-containing protein [Anaerolineales bacterium]